MVGRKRGKSFNAEGELLKKFSLLDFAIENLRIYLQISRYSRFRLSILASLWLIISRASLTAWYELEKRLRSVYLWLWKILPLTTLQLILQIQDFHRDFTTLLGWSYTTSTLTIQSFLARADKDVDDHLKTNSLLWTFWFSAWCCMVENQPHPLWCCWWWLWRWWRCSWYRWWWQKSRTSAI